MRLLKHTLLFSLVCYSSFQKLTAQTLNSDVHREFVLKDSSTIYKSAIILMYTNGTFLNYGIVDNKEEHDVYVWYKLGNWALNDKGISFTVGASTIKAEELKKEVKKLYTTHPDRVLIQGYYEFVHEKYQEGSLRINADEIVDKSKNIEYVEIKI